MLLPTNPVNGQASLLIHIVYMHLKSETYLSSVPSGTIKPYQLIHNFAMYNTTSLFWFSRTYTALLPITLNVDWRATENNLNISSFIIGTSCVVSNAGTESLIDCRLAMHLSSLKNYFDAEENLKRGEVHRERCEAKIPREGKETGPWKFSNNSGNFVVSVWVCRLTQPIVAVAVRCRTERQLW